MVSQSSRVFLLSGLIIFSTNSASQTSVQTKEPANSDTQQPISHSTAVNANIRFYKINKHQQTSKLRVSKSKSAQPGCHNFRGSPRVHSTVQTGFSTCSVYTERNCPNLALIKASHGKSDGFTERLSAGYNWIIEKQSVKDNKGTKLRSWSCQ